VQERRNFQLAAKRSHKEVNEAAPWAEVAAKPPPSEGGNDQKGGEDQEEDVAKLGIKDSANGYYQHDHAQIREGFEKLINRNVYILLIS
jgi:hypothetical protein